MLRRLIISVEEICVWTDMSLTYSGVQEGVMSLGILCMISKLEVGLALYGPWVYMLGSSRWTAGLKCCMKLILSAQVPVQPSALTDYTTIPPLSR
jgi:hypothetical protein